MALLLTRNIILEVAYEGTQYFGWQKTKMGPSIEEILQQVLERILQEQIQLQAASRTDRGVHASGQLANFFTTSPICLEKLLRSLNQLLPKDIAILVIKETEADFHPTMHAKSKEYHYWIQNSQVHLPHLRWTHWHVAQPLDIPLMQQAALILQGHQDFFSFCNQRKQLHYTDTKRTISIDIETYQEKRLCICFVGDRFLYKMVRNLVGTLVYIGLHKIAIEGLSDIIMSRERTRAGITAPAHGLFLHKIYY